MQPLHNQLLGMTLLLVGAWISGTAPAAADNLLANPGFEDLKLDKPEPWDLFVLPQEGAFGRVDSRARTGQRAALLHTPLPYPAEPANNWSQNLLGQFAGKKLVFSGYVRTENATEAAFWLQCWRKQPWGVLRVVSSSATAPVYGTRDWERVEFTVEAPAGTDFLTVRCVLKGVGSAWFDDLELQEQTAPESPAPAPPTAKSPAVPPAPDAAVPLAPQMQTMSQDLERLREANRALAGAMDRMEDANARLMEELLSLREELQNLRSRVNTQDDAKGSAAAEAPPEAPEAAPRVPPLVPHGENWSDQP
jgi:hypothetical protein